MKYQLPIDLTIRVAREDMVARIIRQMPDVETGAFEVKFSDGFSDIFYLMGEEPGNLPPQGTKLGFEPYAKGLQSDLDIAYGIERGNFVQILRFTNGLESINVWLVENTADKIIDNVAAYYDSFCRFTLQRNIETGYWKMDKEYSGDEELNKAIGKEALKILNTGATQEVSVL